MSNSITREPITFASTEENTEIHGYIWREGENERPRGIVHIVHGMAEHIERYDEFARFLAGHGLIVCGYDHLGHGKSVSNTVSWGVLDPREGANHLVEDVHRMRSLMLARTQGTLPYFIFGHSMGSYVTRVYISRHGEGLAGAVICGTGHVAPLVSKAGNLLARLVSATRGRDHKSVFLDNMAAGGFNKSIENPRTEVDWISTSERNVDEYLADEASGFMFAAGGYAALTALTREACSRQAMRDTPDGLPLLFVAGAGDPVGSMGEGVRHAAHMARDAGVRDVTVKIYEGMRHEILNEDERQLVFDDVLGWLDTHLKGAAR